MSNVIDDIIAKAHALWAKLVAESHPAADDAKQILETAETAAKADAEKLAAEEKPIVAEAGADVKDIVETAATTAAADVTQLAAGATATHTEAAPAEAPAPAPEAAPVEATPATEEPAAPQA